MTKKYQSYALMSLSVNYSLFRTLKCRHSHFQLCKYFLSQKVNLSLLDNNPLSHYFQFFLNYYSKFCESIFIDKPISGCLSIQFVITFTATNALACLSDTSLYAGGTLECRTFGAPIIVLRNLQYSHHLLYIVKFALLNQSTFTLQLQRIFCFNNRW